MTLEAENLRRTAFVLVIVGLVWNLVEAGVSLWAGAQAGSVALLAFGLDSFVELLPVGSYFGGCGESEKGTRNSTRS